VRFREGTGRDLRRGTGQSQKRQQQKDDDRRKPTRTLPVSPFQLCLRIQDRSTLFVHCVEVPA
jgi:hypothetical protein